jgi:hypothetical protein
MSYTAPFNGSISAVTQQLIEEDGVQYAYWLVEPIPEDHNYPYIVVDVESNEQQWLTEPLLEGDYKLLVDVESDGQIDGELEIPIKRRIELISPEEKQRFPDFNFDLTWSEHEKEKLDQLFEEISQLQDKNTGRYYVNVDGPSFLGERYIGNDYGILSEPKINLNKDMFYRLSKNLHILEFTNNYFVTEKQDQGKVVFRPVYIKETTTRKIILGNYTKYGGPPSDKDWE